VLGTGVVAFSPWATTPALTAVDAYPDLDGDGFGDSSASPTQFCGVPLPAGWSLDNTDCDDTDPDNFPGNAEVCDLQDNDCNGLADAPGESTDLDGDGVVTCLDCNDANAANYPGNVEICDGIDNDCDGATDNGFADGDADGTGDSCDTCPLDPGALGAATPWDQGFEADTVGWYDQNTTWSGEVVQVASGTGGIVSSAGSFHATATQSDVNQAPGDFTGPFTRFDGYRDKWPGGYQAEIDIYLDTAWPLGDGFDYSVASNGQDGSHQRDFIFHVTKDTSTGGLYVAGSNNSNFAPREDLDTLSNNLEITTSGWYTFRHTFRDDGGALAVDLQVLDSGGTVLFTETRSAAADLISTEVGGNRYGWFTHITVTGGIQIDEHRLILNSGDSDGDGVCDSDDICAGGDDGVDNDSDGVPAFCDCDDADANNYPGNVEQCDGQDNDCSAAVQTSGLGEGGWYSDDTRADGTGTEAQGTNLISDTLTDDPEGSASGTPAHDADILNQIEFVTAPGTVPAGTHPYAVHLTIAPGAGGGKSQISHRKDDGTGHAPGSVFGPDFSAEYSWRGDGTVSVTASLKFGIKTADFASTGGSSRTGENVWDKVLIYEPGNLNGGTSDGLWHTETIDYTTGRWWFFDRTAIASIIGTPMTLEEMSTSTVLVGGGPKTVADVYALITAPGAHITSVQFGIGSGNAGGDVHVNQLVTNFYRAGDVTTFGGPTLADPAANFPGELIDVDGDLALACADCDDNDPANYPGNTEVCDGQDNDCNLLADFPGETTDADGDFSLACADCDDGNASTFPGAAEICDGQDNDCDSVIPVTEIDDDLDGQAECEGDCDDTEPLAYAGNLEVCADGIDNNCDSVVDGGDRYVDTAGSDVDNDCTVAGSPCQTITHAIGQACDGDTANVGAGSFAENLLIDKPLTLACAQAGVPATDVGRVPGGPAETIIDGSGGQVTVRIPASNVTIDGCDVVGDGATYAGVQLANSSTDVTGVTVANNLVHGMALDNPNSVFDFAYGIFGVTGSAGARHQISGLSVTDNRIFGIGNGASVAGAGFYMFNLFGGVPGAGATITGNAFESMAPGDLAPEAGTGVVVLEGADDAGGIPTAPSSGVLVSGNTYTGVVAGAVMFADDSSFDELRTNFGAGTLSFLLNIGAAPEPLGLATVNEPALVPYARTDGPTGFPDSALYTPAIASAVSLSDPGASVAVVGTHGTGATIDRALTIFGSGCGSSVVDGGGSGNLFVVQSSDVTFASMTIRNGTQGIRLENGGGPMDNIELNGVCLEDNSSRGVEVHNAVALTNFRVLGSTFERNSTGIRFASSATGDGILIDGSTFRDQGGTGLDFYQANDGSSGWVANMEVRNSLFENSSFAGIYGEELRALDIHDNVFQGGSRGVYLFKAYVGAGVPAGDIDVHDNQFIGMSKAAVQLWAGDFDDVSGTELDLPFLIRDNTVTVDAGRMIWGQQFDLRLRAQSGVTPLSHAPVTVEGNNVTVTGTFGASSGLCVASICDAGFRIGEGCSSDADCEPAGAVYGVKVRGTFDGVTISNNDFDGGSVGSNGGTPASSGLWIVSDDAFYGQAPSGAQIDVNFNTIVNWDDGVSVYDSGAATYGGLAAGALALVNFNDIQNNALHGVESGAVGDDLDANCNWWGDVGGPGAGPLPRNDAVGNVDVSGFLLANDFGVDGDADGFSSCTLDSGGDCDVALATVYPGAPQICDTLNNDCLDGEWPATTATSGAANEVDVDGDLQSECAGDCNESDDTIYLGAFEFCDGVDHDCDGFLDGPDADDDCGTISGNVCQADFCTSGGTCDFDPSGTCGIAGTVYYDLEVAEVDDFDLTKPVENAVLDLTGDTVDTQLSDPAGDYGFSPVAGTVSLDLARAADANDLDALSSQDAAEIAKFTVALAALSPIQSVAADVSDNGSVTSFDASLVAQKVVNPATVFPVAANEASDWAFFEVPQEFTPIAGDTTALDFKGVVYGDVTLNWTPPGGLAPTSPEGTGAVPVTAAVGDPVEVSLTPRAEVATLYLANAPEQQDDGSWIYKLGIELSDGIQGMDVKLGYRPGTVRLLEARTVGVASGMSVLSHDQENGRASVALWGATPLTGTGEFLELRVAFENGATSGFPFGLHVEANEGLIRVRWGVDLEPVVIGVNPEGADSGSGNHVESDAR
jgi:nitrous oxidase accessory protein NosD